MKIIIVGENRSEENVVTKRPGNGICSSNWAFVIDKIVECEIDEDSPIRLEGFY